IPWIYVDDKDRFTEADNVYWSKAFNKLTNKKYTVVKDLLEKENSQVLTLLSFGEIIDLFSLKVNITIDFNWSCLNDVSLDEMNVLLDWMEQDGSFNDFFESYYIQENIDYYDIKENTSFSVYDGTNIELKQYIDSIKELDDVYFELPSVLYTKNRYKLGLLQSEQLILSIIESKDFNQDLVLYLASTFSNENFNRLVLNLGEFVLSSSTIYKVDSPESIIISKLLKQIEDVDNIPMDLNNIIEDLREKIVVDSKSLSDYDLSNRVIFGKADNRKVLQLSDILNDLQGDSDILDNLIESFVSITNKGNLRKVFFRTRQMSYYEIYS
ncbi:ATP-binding protein, partial [Myroides odoratimimus]|nr:ATP-binding protein [Myroides odoratimimus]